MNGFEARERAHTDDLTPQEALARRLFEAHRAAGSAYWRELTYAQRAQWIRVARHVEQHER